MSDAMDYQSRNCKVRKIKHELPFKKSARHSDGILFEVSSSDDTFGNQSFMLVELVESQRSRPLTKLLGSCLTKEAHGIHNLNAALLDDEDISSLSSGSQDEEECQQVQTEQTPQALRIVNNIAMHISSCDNSLDDIIMADRVLKRQILRRFYLAGWNRRHNIDQS